MSASAAARFVAAVGEAGDALGHHPSASVGPGYVDLALISDDAIYLDDGGTEHVIAWVPQRRDPGRDGTGTEPVVRGRR